MALWAAFAMTLQHSMQWLLARPLAAVLFGAMGGPLAYSGAARGFDAVVFNMPLQATLLLGFGWGFAMWLLVAIARVDPATTLVQREVSA